MFSHIFCNTRLIMLQALHIAYMRQSVELAVALIAVGASLFCVNNLGKLPAECGSKVILARCAQPQTNAFK